MKILSLCLILLLISCGKQSLTPNEVHSLDPLHESNSKSLIYDNGTYVAVLNPINTDKVGISSGSVTINIYNDEMITNIRFAGQAPAIIHSQSIHSGSFCPTEIADSNMDGYIDIRESLPYTSQILIPLDTDLNSQAGGQGFYPLADDWGTYIYSFLSSFNSLMSDLYAKDENTTDELVKLIPGSPLDLSEKVVVIYGTLDSEKFPETVETLPGLTPNQTIPIACGKFSKINKFPGVPLPDETTESAPSRIPDRNRPGNIPQKPHSNDQGHHSPSPMCHQKACIL